LDIIKNSVIQENSEIFNRVPGIGKKTAQSIVLQLQGKISKNGKLPGVGNVKIDDEVVSALTDL
jgi:Holliday junction DNA helicase RuvA